MTDDDRDLYERFSALRREEEAGVPPMSFPAAAVRRHGRRWIPVKLAVTTACLAVMIGALWLLFVSPGPRLGGDRDRGQTVGSITSWKPATDFLLDTPGRELLQGVPDIGEHPATIAPRAVERHRLSMKHVLP
jgi:hypothetical protein